MKVSLVVPVFNEEATIPIFYKTVREFEELKPYEVEIVFINDGSKDATESIINKIAASDPLVIPLSFTRNFGKEPA
ncbi:glycosyltransferase, partial [Salmonella enterica]